jgi:hypothetical protein
LLFASYFLIVLPAEVLVPDCNFWQVDIAVGSFKKYKLSGVVKVQEN